SRKRICMTNKEKVEAMIGWLKEHQNDFPKSFVLCQATTVLNSRGCVEVLYLRLENYLERNLFGCCFKASYFKAYQMKRWYELNVPNATTTIRLLLEEEAA